jgi:CRISPR-associated protein Csb2
LLDEHPLHYLWPIAEEDWLSSRQHVELLCQEARHLLALGWGIDVVVGNGRVLNDEEAARLAGVRWKPWNGYHSPNGSRRRVPKEGTLGDLGQVHKSFLTSVKGRQYRRRQEPKIFNLVTYMEATKLPPRPYVVFELRNQEDGWAAFRQVDAVTVAAMLRSQTCQAAQHDSHQFPAGSEAYVAGHVGEQQETPPRFSYLPLPTIAHPHADGFIRRAVIAEPHGSDGAHVRWAKFRLRNRELVSETHETTAILIPSKNHDNVSRAYVDTAQNWFSVTPVILPGFDDGKHTKAEKLLMKTIAQAGFPLEGVEEIVLRKAPYWPGSQHPNLYHKPRYLKQFPAWHVMVRFRDPIPGPLAMGAGRHCGLGVFAQENSRTD